MSLSQAYLLDTYTLDDLEHYRVALERVKEAVDTRPRRIRDGLCGCLKEAIGTRYALGSPQGAYALVKEMSERWFYYSKVIGFPVPHPELSAEVAYYTDGISRWDPATPYGRMRRHLLDWLTAEVRHAIYLKEYAADEEAQSV